MDLKKMLQQLEARESAYRFNHNLTADMDIMIFRLYCSGESVLRIALKIPCSESTVYRAIHRVRSFLRIPDVFPLLEMLRKHIAENPPNYGDWNAQSVLEMLYVAFGENNRFESAESLQGFDRLYEALTALPISSIDPVIDTVCDLCHLHERDGFTEGIKLGFRLNQEMNY